MALDLKLAFGMIGNATATALFLSPAPTFYRIARKGTTGEYSALPYVCTLFNCLLWVLYGMPAVKPHALLILTINGLGIALELLYLLLFLAFAARPKQIQMMKWLLAVVVTYVLVILVVLVGLHTLSRRQLAAGSVCVVVAIAMYASPLSVMGLVIRTRSVEYMPFLLSLFNFLNGAVWSGYSIVTKDIFVAIPNGLGCLSGIAQLVLYAMYRNATPRNNMPTIDSVDLDNVKKLQASAGAKKQQLASFDGNKNVINSTKNSITSTHYDKAHHFNSDIV